MNSSASLPEVLIKRDFDNDLTGPTFGKLSAPGGFQCDTLERPLTVPDHPRINLGRYRVKASNHPIHGLCYELEDRDGRTAILIHPANWWEQLLGCISLGRAVMVVEGDWQGRHIREMGVSSSKDAVDSFFKHMGGLDFMLTIS